MLANTRRFLDQLAKSQEQSRKYIEEMTASLGNDIRRLSKKQENSGEEDA